MESKTLDAFERLSDILDTLRRECPWDRKQTLKSLRYLTIEEVHELSEAIVQVESAKLKVENDADPDSNSQLSASIFQLEKELGDLAMHVMFYMKIAEEQGLFTAADVYNAICDKLVARHPFIYDKENYHDESWEQLKMREGRRNVLEGVPDSLPSMIKAVRMQEKVAGMEGGEWRVESGERRVESGELERRRLAGISGERRVENGERRAESGELERRRLAGISGEPKEDMTEEEFGDYLFALIDWARRHGINADDALCGANARFKDKYC